MWQLIFVIVATALALATLERLSFAWPVGSLLAGIVAGLLAQPVFSPYVSWTGEFLAFGVVLIGSSRWAGWLTVPACLIAGGLAGCGADPQLIHDPVQIAVLAIVAAGAFGIAAVAKRWARNWLAIPRRIAASWMIAAGLLMLALLAKPAGFSIAQKTTPAFHDPNLPHIHGENGEIIYLPTGHGAPVEEPKKKPGAPRGITDQNLP